jgi:hypothetical protein
MWLCYTLSMLSLRHDSDQTRLYIAFSPQVTAWITKIPGYSPPGKRDWQLWLQLQSGPSQTRKCQARLAVESHLRAWLLRRHTCRLFDLSFADLCALAEQPGQAVHRLQEERAT